MSLPDSKNAKKIIDDSLEIQKLLSKFKGTRTIVDFEISGKSYQGLLKEVSDVTISIGFKGIIVEAATFVEINIASGLTIYNFRSSILDLEDNEMILSTPSEMRTLIKRKYKRVKIESEDEANIEFTIISGEISATASGKVSPKYAQIHEELSKQTPDIKAIVHLIYMQLKTYADEYDINLYKKDEKFFLPVNIVKVLKETYFVRDIKDRKSYLSSALPKVVSLGSYLKYLTEKGQKEEDIKKIMISAISEDAKRGYRSYIFSPISLFGEVIGHIYVGNMRTGFSDQNVYITINMAEIISEAFVKTKLFQLETKGTIKSKIINLSAGGALIEINDQYVIKFIKPNTRLKLHLQIKDVTGKLHDFNCSAKVIRIFFINGKIQIGIKFMELRWNEHDIIDKFVRKKIEFKQALNS